MRRQLKPHTVATLGIVLVLGLWAAIIIRRSTIPQFEFLRGHGSTYSVHPSAVGWPGYEYDIYCWRQDWAGVRESAMKELSRKGFVLSVDPKLRTVDTWTKGRQLQVLVASSRYMNTSDPASDRQNPDWTSVTVLRPLPDTWVGHLKYALAPSR